MAARESTTIVAPRRWSFRTLAQPAGVAFGIGTVGGQFLAAGLEAFRRAAYTEAAGAFAILVLCSIVSSIYAAAFNSWTRDVVKVEA
jgi:hypothetical protein